MGFLWYIIIGIAAGFLAGKIMRGGGFGVIINLILGIVGRMAQDKAGIKNRQSKMSNWQLHQKDIYDM